ncbi:MAG: response regulator [Phycisphaerales bacterium]|nr:response regulator [Phycisphaerales bacterium]
MMPDKSDALSIPSADSRPVAIPPPRRILVADDEHLVAEVISKSLVSLDYEVIGPVANGAQAIKLARQVQPDMAILDIRMPEVDGLAAAQVLIREMNIAILMITAYSDEAYLRDTCEIGIHGYVLKPTSTEQLRVAITMAWARYQQHMGLSTEVSRLQSSLSARKAIEKAKWVLVERCSISEDEAHRRLQKQARDKRRSMAEVAESILESYSLLSCELDRPTPSEPT